MNELKNNRFVRAGYFFVKQWLGVKRNKFGFCGKDVVLSPPFFIDKPGNVYLYDKTNIGANSYLAVPNAKFIIKSHCSIAEGLTVHTGNHARLKGRFVSDITDADKPDGYDKDIVVENDVWIGCNVTLFIVWNYSWSRRNDCGRSCGVKRCSSLLHSGWSACKGVKILLDN